MSKGYIYNDWVYAGDPAPLTDYFTSGLIPVDLVSYELPYETAQGATGRVVIAGDLKTDYSNHIIRIDDKLYHIKQSSSVSGGNTTLTVGDDASIFDDAMMFSRRGNDSSWYFIGAFPDARYPSTPSKTFPYLYGRPKNYRSYVTDSLIEQMEQIWFDPESILFDGVEEITEGGVSLYPINIAKMIRLLRTKGLVIDYTLDTKYLNATLVKIARYEKETPIFDKDGHSDIISADFSNNVCSYVWVVTTVQTAQYIYANIDGRAVNLIETYPMPEPSRLGFTSIIQDKTVRTESAAQALAQAEIDKNTFNHKIVFESDKELHIGQPVVVCLDRGNYRSTISSVIKKSNTDRLQYTCGDLPVTASDLIRDNSWAYNTIPKNPRKGQLIFV